MKNAFVLVAALLFCSSAWAQSPQESPPPDLISLSVGQAKSFRFEQPFAKIEFMPKDTADAVPQSDRQLSVVGIKTGTTHMFVFGSNGSPIYSAEVAVAPESGRMVKIYGATSKDDISNRGFEVVYCDEFGCGRPDKDMPKPSVSVERIIRERR